MSRFLLVLMMTTTVGTSWGFNGRLAGWCEQGGQVVQVNGVNSTQRVQRSYPACQVVVYLAGTTTPATIYSDTVNTPLANPFTATSLGYWFFYAADNFYDVRISGGGLSAPFTFSGLNINTSSGGGGGGAPTNATYWLASPNGSLGSAINLGALTAGLVKVTAGIPTTAVAADLPAHAPRHQFGGDDQVASLTPGANTIVMSRPDNTIDPGWIPATTVSAGLYGAASAVPQIVIGADGRVTSATNVAIAGVPPSGSAGGDLTGTYPNPSLASVAIAGTYGGATAIPQFSIDSKGRIISVVPFSISLTGIAAGGVLNGTYPNPGLAASGVSPAIYGNISGNAVSVPRLTIDVSGRVASASLVTDSFWRLTDAVSGDASGLLSALSVNKINGTSLAGLGTGILKNTTGTGTPSIAGNSDVIGTWTGTCNSTTFLRGDGSCAAPAGVGTVTNSATLTSGRLVIGDGTTVIKVGDLSGVVQTSGSTVTTFTDGRTGSGAIVGQTLATLASPTLFNPLMNSVYDQFSQWNIELSPNVGGPSAQGGHLKLQVPTTTPPANVSLTAVGDNAATPNLVFSAAGKVMVDLGLLRFTGAAPVIGQVVTASSTSGDLTWTTVVGTGTVTNVATTTPISGGPITTTGTISCPTCDNSAAALTNNQLVLGAGSHATQILAAGTAGQFLQSNGAGSAPTWVAGTGGVTSVATTGPISGGTITTTGTISCPTCDNSASTLTNNQLMLGQGSHATAVLTAGTSGQVLQSAGSGSAPVWLTVNSPITASGSIGCATCVTAASALTNNQIVLGAGSQASQILAPGTNGQILMSSGPGSAPIWLTKASAATASTAVFHDSIGATEVRDNGGQVYNVKAFGAFGDCTSNSPTFDTTFIQAAIDAAQNSTRGGTVYFPPGCYMITSGLTIGNGTTVGGSPNTTTESTQKPVTLQGINTGVDSSHRGASIIKWGGTNTAVWMLEYRGPLIGGEINDLIFDVGTFPGVGVAVKGVRLRHAAHMYSRNLGIIQAALGMEITTEGNASYGACDNTFIGLKITQPAAAVSGANGGNGLNLAGYDATGATVDSCSNTFYAPMIWHDANDNSTYGVRLGVTDNNRFFGANLYGFPNSIYSTGTVSITNGNVNVTGSGTSWVSGYNSFPMIIFGSPAACGAGGPCRTYTFTYTSSTTGTLSPTPDVTVSGAAYAIRGGGTSVLLAQGSVSTSAPLENTFYSTSMHQGPKGVAGSGTPNAFYDFHVGDCWTYCLISQRSVTNVDPIFTASDRTSFGVGTATYVGNTTSYTYLTGQDTAGTQIFSMKRGATSTNGLELTSFDDFAFSSTGSGVVRGKLKLYSGTTQPYACASTFEGTGWIDTTGTAHVFKLCGRNSSSAYVWSTVFTFP